jgi:hypothetical protein
LFLNTKITKDTKMSAHHCPLGDLGDLGVPKKATMPAALTDQETTS